MRAKKESVLNLLWETVQLRVPNLEIRLWSFSLDLFDILFYKKMMKNLPICFSEVQTNFVCYIQLILIVFFVLLFLSWGFTKQIIYSKILIYYCELDASATIHTWEMYQCDYSQERSCTIDKRLVVFYNLQVSYICLMKNLHFT